MCPAGGDIPDPKLNDKFAHKLDFLREMASFFAKRKRTAPVILLGDLNVAPLENDVWSHKQLLDVVSHTPVETELLGEARAAFDWTDVTRAFVPPTRKSIPGGAIAPPTGKLPIAAAGWITSGSALR